ncbi:hypothetical protein [Falsochrobactrum shanghaiense]|uniref:hypothetical protein n=1 Tax=Falsochrobactrum shanghaiense TaxID=2201899 RepID=UPI0011B20871|nr:hypothetical protein [Falsochrobactrum shanghaiense]
MMVIQKIFQHLFSIKRFDIPQINALPVTLIIVTFIAGCSTVKPTPQCTPQQAMRLSKNIVPFEKKLIEERRNLSQARMMSARQGCKGSLFSPGVRSRQCEQLTMRIDGLQKQIRLSEARLSEMHAAMAGRPHAAEHVKACSAGWLHSATKRVRKAKPKRPSAKAARPVKLPQSVKPKANAEQNAAIRHEVIPAAAMAAPKAPEMTRPAYHVAPARPENAIASPATHSHDPVAGKAAMERNYSASPQIRIIGSSFFPDQSGQGDRPVPVRESVP